MRNLLPLILLSFSFLHAETLSPKDDVEAVRAAEHEANRKLRLQIYDLRKQLDNLEGQHSRLHQNQPRPPSSLRTGGGTIVTQDNSQEIAQWNASLKRSQEQIDVLKRRLFVLESSDLRPPVDRAVPIRATKAEPAKTKIFLLKDGKKVEARKVQSLEFDGSKKYTIVTTSGETMVINAADVEAITEAP